MHSEIREPRPGTCPKCGMDLMLEGANRSIPKRNLKDFAPLVIILGIIFVLTATTLFLFGHWDIISVMRYFEGFFFLIFGIFKLLNWKGFVDAYSTYDIIAKRSRLYGYSYPLIELGLAAGYLFGFQLLIIAWITLVLMLVGSIGVAQELKKGNQIPCACLGVVFKIPMTWVTFTEDIIMALMAALMIFIL